MKRGWIGWVPLFQAQAGCLLGWLCGKLPFWPALTVSLIGVIGLALWIEARSVRRGW